MVNVKRRKKTDNGPQNTENSRFGNTNPTATQIYLRCSGRINNTCSNSHTADLSYAVFSAYLYPMKFEQCPGPPFRYVGRSDDKCPFYNEEFVMYDVDLNSQHSYTALCPGP